MTEYEIGDYQFKPEEFFPTELFEEITNVRVDRKEVILEEAQSRKKRDKLTKDGKLLILATDHPARRVTSIRDEPLKMGSRHEYLARIVRIMSLSGFDGVMGTTDMIEDLLITNRLVKEKGGESFLDNKVLLGCMNRGGLLDTVFEMHDTYTSFTPKSLKEMRMDGGKMMYRLDRSDEGAGKTIWETAEVITRMNELNIPVFLEPLSAVKTEEGYKIKKDYQTLIKDIGVATALGSSSKNMWLKIPYVDNFDQVTKATTCPVLMLGGPAREDPTSTIDEFVQGMATSPKVRGALVGRNVSFPFKDDPMAVADAIAKVVHEGYSTPEAIHHLMEVRGENMDVLTRHL